MNPVRFQGSWTSHGINWFGRKCIAAAAALPENKAFMSDANHIHLDIRRQADFFMTTIYYPTLDYEPTSPADKSIPLSRLLFIQEDNSTGDYIRQVFELARGLANLVKERSTVRNKGLSLGKYHYHNGVVSQAPSPHYDNED